MINKYIVFGSPKIGYDEIDEVVSTLKTSWIGTGPKTKKFEEMFANYKNTKFVCSVNSCTAALHLALVSLNLKKSDEVIVPAMTFCSTVNSVIMAGAKPILADVNISTMNICPKQIEKKITKNTKAVILVHFAGYPCEIDKIKNIVGKKIKIIEDCAHAIEGTYFGKPLGTFGDFGCFSFYATKNITTAEGGMVICKTKKNRDAIREMSLHGLSLDAWGRYSKTGFKKYYVSRLGYKYNMTDIAAALGVAQLRKIKDFRKRREMIWQKYNKSFYDLPIKLPIEPKKGYMHSYHLYTLIIDKKLSKISRDEFMQKMHKKNIGTGIHYQAIPEHKYYKNYFKWKLNDYPNAKYLGKNTVSIPLSPNLTNKEIKYIINTVRNILN